ncbi:unnamed protein product [Scytosiphon promiscuus]
MPRAFAPLLNVVAAACAKHCHCPSAAAFVALGSATSGMVSTGSDPFGASRSLFEARLGRRSPSAGGGTATAAPILTMAAASLSTAGGGGGPTEDLPFRYRWPRPAVTVDCLIYTLDDGRPWILLIRRKNDPFRGSWALPGGFVDQNEGLEAAALRELEEETGVTGRTMVQTGAYGNPGRDPRGHTITVAFMAWAPSREACNARAGDDAAEARFFPVESLPRMAFDHLKVITDSWARCRFEATSPTDGGNDSGGVTVGDRASGQNLADYAAPPSSVPAGMGAQDLALLLPAEEPSPPP